MRRAIAVLIVAVGLCAAPVASADSLGVETLLKDALTTWSVKSSPSDTMYLEGGKWVQDSLQTPAKTQGGPAVAAATMYRRTGDWKWYSMAVQTVGWMLNNGQRADGAFADPSDTAAAIPTEMFMQSLAVTYLLLESEPHFLPEQGAWWRSKMTKAADFLIAHGDSTWYANGNVNVGYMAAFYFAWRVTGQARFRAAYEQQYGYAQIPNTNQFKSYGWQFTTFPSTRTGEDGAGYFTENNSTTAPGFDAEYTGVQLDQMVGLYVFVGDRDIVRLTNMLLNQILPRVSRTTWQFDTSGGTRHGEAVRTVPYLSGAIDVMEENGRTDLAGLGEQQWPFVDSKYREPGGPFFNANPDFYSSLGQRVAMRLVDEMTRGGQLARVP